MRIRYRLLLGFMTVVAVFILFGGYVFAIWQSMSADMHNLDVMFETVSEQNLHELDMTLHLGRSLDASHQQVYAYLMGNEGAQTDLRLSTEEFNRYYTDLSATIAAAPESASTAKLLDALVRIEAEHEHFEAHVAEIVALVERDDVTAATTLWTDKMAEEVTAMSAALDVIEEDIEVRTHETAASFDAVLHAVEARIRSLQNVMIGVLALATFLAFGIGFFTANTISQPIEQLSNAAIAVEAGSFDPDEIKAVTARKDELGSFARIFQHMAEEVYRRERQLRERISAMRIEIDRQKSREQVAEITETDFFKDLQSKARALRGDTSTVDS